MLVNEALLGIFQRIEAFLLSANVKLLNERIIVVMGLGNFKRACESSHHHE